VQRVELMEGMALLHLPNNRVLVAQDWMTLVDQSDILVAASQHRGVAGIFEALQAWNGRSVTCTGEIKELNGKRYMEIMKDRSNLEFR
jgi:hypothetical protein